MNLVESDGSNSDSEMNKIDEENHDRATVDTDSFEQVHGQHGGNIDENAISCELSQLSKWNISMLMVIPTVQNFNFI